MTLPMGVEGIIEMQFCVAHVQGDQATKEVADAHSLVCNKNQQEKQIELSSLSHLFPHLERKEPQRFSYLFRPK